MPEFVDIIMLVVYGPRLNGVSFKSQLLLYTFYNWKLSGPFHF